VKPLKHWNSDTFAFIGFVVWSFLVIWAVFGR